MKANLRQGNPPRRRRKGSLLVYTLVFATLIGVTLIPVVQFTIQTTRVAGGTRSSDQAFYAAEAGASRAIAYLTGVVAPSPTLANGLSLAFATSYLQNATSANPYRPWGNNWLTLDMTTSPPADTTDNNARIASKVKIWKNADGTFSIQSTGKSTFPSTQYRTITVQTQSFPFSGYAFFNADSVSAIDGLPRWLASGETFNGVVHTNRHLFVYGTAGSPLTFNSDVQIVGSEVKQAAPNNVVVYNGQKQLNAPYVELPSDLSPLINASDNGGVHLPAADPTITPATYVDPVKKMNGASLVSNINNYQFTFNSNGTVSITNLDKYTWMTGASAQAVTWRNSFSPALTTSPNGGTAGAKASFSVTIANTNGAFVVDEGNVLVNGTVKGRVTIAARANKNSTALIPPMNNERSDGNLIVNGNIIYSTHPTGSGAGYTNGYLTADNRNFDPNTVTDVLGLIGERNFALDRSCPSNCLIDAHIMMTGQASPNPDVRTWNQTTNTSTVIPQAINQDGSFYIEDGVQRDLSELWTGVVDSDDTGDGTSTNLNHKGTNNNLYLTGGIVHFVRGQTANGTGGYTRKYAYDTRLSTSPPPYYPLQGSAQIIGWSDVPSTTDPT